MKMEDRVGAITARREQSQVSQTIPLGGIHHPGTAGGRCTAMSGSYPRDAAARLGFFVSLGHGAAGGEGEPDLGQFQPQTGSV